MHSFDQRLSRQFLLAAFRAANSRPRLRSQLAEWIHESEVDLRSVGAAFLVTASAKRLLAEDEDEGFAGHDPLFRRRSRREVPRPDARLRQYFARVIPRLEASLAGPGPARTGAARATQILVNAFRLKAPCGTLLDLVRLHSERGSVVYQTWDRVNDEFRDQLATTAALLGISRRSVEAALRRLDRAGLGDPEDWGRAGADPDDYLNRWVERIYSPPVTTVDELRTRLAPRAAPPLLGLRDFEHLDERDDALRLLKGALRRGAGLRVLLYGRPGTGKTEFAKTLAHAAEARLYDIGGPLSRRSYRAEEDHHTHDRPSRNRNRLRFAEALLRSDPGAVILCDEVEDVLSSEPGRRRQSHSMLEESRVPVLFTGNDLSRFDEAVLRRFDLMIRFRPLSPRRRRSVVRRMLRTADLQGVGADRIDGLAVRLADELECPPAIIERAIHATRLVKGSAEDLFRFAERNERVLSRRTPRPRLGPPVEAELGWAAFAHLGEPAEDIRRVLTAAVAARKERRRTTAPVSALFHGPPGGGKTAFCHALAAEAGATLYAVGQRDPGVNPRPSAPRSEALAHAMEALADEPGAVLLFDEIEDLVFDRPKFWLNSLLEECRVPLLMTANATEALRRHLPHFLDRVTCSLEFRHIPRRRRASMFRDLLGGDEESRREALVTRLAEDRRVTPRAVRNAAQVASLTGLGIVAARRAVEAHQSLRYGRSGARSKPGADYDVALICARPDLRALRDRILEAGSGRLGLLLDGPSGSGKSVFARQLALEMGLDPVVKRASGLLSSWVGETEKRIAAAFAEARVDGGFLIIDEADSFLFDRRDASRTWETSMVNEVLSQLETHDGPYAFTTNLADRLDPAVARRFLFRATFDYLDRPRVERAFVHFFGAEAPPAVLALTRLVPADFALVRERASVLGYLDDVVRLEEELRAQSVGREARTHAGFRIGSPMPVGERRP